LRAVRSPLAPKMTMVQGSGAFAFRADVATRRFVGCLASTMAQTMAQAAGKFNAVARESKIARPRRFFATFRHARMKAKIIITPKKAVFDPQGKTVKPPSPRWATPASPASTSANTSRLTSRPHRQGRRAKGLERRGSQIFEQPGHRRLQTGD